MSLPSLLLPILLITHTHTYLHMANALFLFPKEVTCIQLKLVTSSVHLSYRLGYCFPHVDGVQAHLSLMPSLCVPLGKILSGERSRISWAYYPKVVRTNEIMTSLGGMSVKCFERCQVTLLQKHVLAQEISTWFTRPFLLVRGWGLGTRLGSPSYFSPSPFSLLLGS